MGQAKVKKTNGKYPAAQAYKAKVMVASMRDITTAYLERASKLGYVMLVIAIPDEEAHGPGSAQNVGIYGTIPSTETQVAVMREIADRIENSDEGQAKEKLNRADH